MDDVLFRTEWGPLFFWTPLLGMLALLVVGLTYFLAPALGYSPYNRGLLLGSVWVLIAKMALVIFKMGIFFLEEIDGKSAGTGGGPGTGGTGGAFAGGEQILSMLFFMLDSSMFILAMALFAGGLASLRRDADALRPLPPRSFPND
jgi:hypothetical protein